MLKKAALAKHRSSDIAHIYQLQHSYARPIRCGQVAALPECCAGLLHIWEAGISRARAGSFAPYFGGTAAAAPSAFSRTCTTAMSSA